MSDPLKTRLKQLIVTTLKLEDVAPAALLKARAEGIASAAEVTV